MNELLRKRIDRRLASLSDEMGYRVLDYVEFLESKYGTRTRESSGLQKIADSVEDVMRVGGVPVAAIRGTMQAVDAAGKVMDGISAAGRTVFNEIQKAAEEARQGIEGKGGDGGGPAAQDKETAPDGGSGSDRNAG